MTLQSVLVPLPIPRNSQSTMVCGCVQERHPDYWHMLLDRNDRSGHEARLLLGEPRLAQGSCCERQRLQGERFWDWRDGAEVAPYWDVRRIVGERLAPQVRVLFANDVKQYTVILDRVIFLLASNPDSRYYLLDAESDDALPRTAVDGFLRSNIGMGLPSSSETKDAQHDQIGQPSAQEGGIYYEEAFVLNQNTLKSL